MKKRKYDLFDVNNINKNILAKEHFNKLFSKKHLTIGQRTADAISNFVGSWIFLVAFLLLIVMWVIMNVYLLVEFEIGAFDPYPFILLNLVLGGIAAIQAPIILMSQNRQAERDRIRAHYDYAVNKKAEKEIRDIQKDLSEIKKKLSVK